jgi:uncharacterized protein
VQIIDGRLVFSPSDLNHYVECRHLVTLETETLAGARFPRSVSEAAELYARRASEHEAAYLARLRDYGREIVAIGDSRDPGDLPERAAETRAAMERGAEVIYQAVFFDGRWRGTADFLVRVDEPGAHRQYGYEAYDAKLARSPKPYYIVQLCAYSEMIARAQGSPPRRMHVVLGDFRVKSYEVAAYAPYFRSLRDRFVREVEALPALTR